MSDVTCVYLERSGAGTVSVSSQLGSVPIGGTATIDPMAAALGLSECGGVTNGIHALYRVGRQVAEGHLIRSLYTAASFASNPPLRSTAVPRTSPSSRSRVSLVCPSKLNVPDARLTQLLLGFRLVPCRGRCFRWASHRGARRNADDGRSYGSTLVRHDSILSWTADIAGPVCVISAVWPGTRRRGPSAPRLPTRWSRRPEACRDSPRFQASVLLG